MTMTTAALRAALWRSALFAGLWWALADGRTANWGVGLVSILLAVGLSLHLLPPLRHALSGVGLLRFVGFFLYQSLRGGTQVALIALRPRALQPATLDIALRLPAGIGRIVLVNTLNLLPGTLCVGLDGERLSLHVIDQGRATEAGVRHAEMRVARLLGLQLKDDEPKPPS